ncbi:MULTISPECIES: SMC-Scp complex subunit ScpB [Auritidibacter]|uniref:SMC-Scp complex subunit ScpB n=1 Tax=Auritidibacter TaxID=1160973 RepID=UPI00169B80B4|nr:MULTISPECIES: SMC-Scp complex subunit ScpB [Auritidibacter]NIH72381.1 segregation and condensation protein B [Auritidibacter ignavus]WGH82378.1 SMC-Scp complex subunit ScpB [Auritidibacter ignavus]WGH84636.1 SMC-Scp complex subunit ScpB [Auritidibacter ignavus]WGH86947.1 SMC-Scp complex subunit ScpB [Auritidibacter ignavus]WGH89232.1 SMC-Scp complex subunit ScpB [Auritidibacter ignavus]
MTESLAELRASLEAVLMVIEEPVTIDQLVQATEATPTEVLQALERLRADYDGEATGPRRGFELRDVAGGWRIYSRGEYEQTVERFMVRGATAKLSPAASEALAVIAYLQPTTRSRVAQIRGVNSDSVIRSLQTRGLIQDSGQDPLTQAVLYTTTGYFLELLGLDSVADLPKLSPLLPGLADLTDLDIPNDTEG